MSLQLSFSNHKMCNILAKIISTIGIKISIILISTTNDASTKAVMDGMAQTITTVNNTNCMTCVVKGL